MKTTVDRFGRVVVPRDIRDRLGMRPGSEIEIDEKGDEVVLRLVEREPSLKVKEGVLVLSGAADGDLRGAIRAHRLFTPPSIGNIFIAAFRRHIVSDVERGGYPLTMILSSSI